MSPHAAILSEKRNRRSLSLQRKLFRHGYGNRGVVYRRCHRLLDLHEFARFRLSRRGRLLRRPPSIKYRNLVHAGNRTMRRARLLSHILAADVFYGVLLEWNRRIAALLRAVVHQPVFADVEISRTCPAAPGVRTAQSYIVLKRVDP